jgi:hypothetical protein
MTEQKKSRIRKVAEKLHLAKPSDRVNEAMSILRREAGMIPIFNILDLERRRSEIREILEDVEAKKYLDHKIKMDVVNKTFRLFFQTGSPWVRGLDNRELSHKVACFLQLYNELRELPAFTSDLFMCSIQLLHLSFQALDVTNTPPYIVVTQPIISPYGPRIPIGETGGGGGEGGPRALKHEEV